MEQNIEKLLLNLGNDIQGTFLMDIAEIDPAKVREPGMKVGDGPNFKVVGQMTDFEKKCFHLFFLPSMKGTCPKNLKEGRLTTRIGSIA